MTRGRKAGLALLLVFGALLAANTIVLDNETEAAKARNGGRVLQLDGGDLNVKVDGKRSDPPVVLIHCYTCSIRWWQSVARDLARDRRVIRVDLLGHGGSEKPKDGYTMENQARLVEQALDRLGVREATVAGHSMGGNVATALAEQAPERVERVVIVDTTPSEDLGELPFLARVAYLPVIGEAAARLATDGVVESQLQEAFAEDFDVPSFAVDDYRATTYPSYKKSSNEGSDFRERRALTERLAEAGVPVLAIYGAEDSIVDAERAIEEFERNVPGATTREIGGVGHSPPVEAPKETARLIRSFSR